jgi:hypothetical protein
MILLFLEVLIFQDFFELPTLICRSVSERLQIGFEVLSAAQLPSELLISPQANVL